jgi:DNA invertase Pin-like site-specific DNA recombinase
VGRTCGERTKAALQAAKARGTRLGNPRLADAREAINARSKATADTFAAAAVIAIREAQAAGAKSLREIAAALNTRGVATARGGRWEAQTVANVLRRAGGVWASRAGGRRRARITLA